MAPTHPDRSSIEAPFNFDAEAGISGIKLGCLPEAFGEGANEVDRAALAAARRLGIEVKEVSLPDLPYGALMNIVYAEAAAFEELTLDDVRRTSKGTLKWQDNGAWPNTFRKARFLSAVDHVQLDRLRYRVMLALDDPSRGRRADRTVYDRADARRQQLHGPPLPALRAGFLDLATRGEASLGSGKLTAGEPQAAGRTFKVPQGVSLWGRLFEEGVILNHGLALERELAIAVTRPGLRA